MTQHAPNLELPLALVGVSDQVADWLRQAGLPAERLGQESVLKSAFRWKRRNSASAGTDPLGCLLFDSRDVWSRAVVKIHQKDSRCVLDVAKLLAQTGAPAPAHFSTGEIANASRFAFLEQLKTAIEAAGGVWARLADLPFPYQGVGCLNGEWPNAFDTNEPRRLSTIQERYFAGLPTMLSASEAARLAELAPATGLQSSGLPLLWRTDSSEFARWWRAGSLSAQALAIPDALPRRVRADARRLLSRFGNLAGPAHGQRAAPFGIHRGPQRRPGLSATADPPPGRVHRRLAGSDGKRAESTSLGLTFPFSSVFEFSLPSRLSSNARMIS